jgi:hypothetical protein
MPKIKNLFKHYRGLSSHKIFYIQLATGILLLCASLFINNFANNYTASHYSSGVSDIILDHLPTVDVEFVFLEGAIALIIFIALLCLYKPLRFPFMCKTVALFIAVRAFFLTLTHLGPPLREAVFLPQSIFERLIYGSGDDLFFSGHVGLPFLMALIFWQNKPLRIFFLLMSVFFAGVVLLGHLHYSIDVFSAFFISYGIFHIALHWFKKDRQLFLKA